MKFAIVLLEQDEAVDENEPEAYSASSVIAPFETELLASAWWFARPHLHDEYAYEIVPLGDPAQPLPPNYA